MVSVDASSQTELVHVICMHPVKSFLQWVDTINVHFGTEHYVFLSNDECDGLTEILEIAKTGDRKKFIWRLSWFAQEALSASEKGGSYSTSSDVYISYDPYEQGEA